MDIFLNVYPYKKRQWIAHIIIDTLNDMVLSLLSGALWNGDIEGNCFKKMEAMLYVYIQTFRYKFMFPV